MNGNYCPKCGKENASANRFCSRCGCELAAARPEPEESADVRLGGDDLRTSPASQSPPTPGRIVAGGAVTINQVQPRTLICDLCGQYQEQDKLFQCKRCGRNACKRHLNTRHLVCEECAAILEEDARGEPCGFPGCSRNLRGIKGVFECRLCGKTMCANHEDTEVQGHCLHCAEKSRQEQFHRATAKMPPPGETATAFASITQPAPPFNGRIWTESGGGRVTRDISVVSRDSKGCYRIGDRFSLNVQVDRDCYLTLLDIGTSGTVALLLQNGLVRAGSPQSLSGPDASHEWVIGGPPGIERLKAFFTLERLDLFPGATAFSGLGDHRATRDIVNRINNAGMMLNQMPPDSWLDATCEFVVEAR